jgi:hypothetical protein
MDTSSAHHFFLLVCPAAIMIILLMFHSYFFRGPRFTLQFFSIFSLAGFVREYTISQIDHFNGMPQYYSNLAAPRFLGVPLTHVLGWLIVAYLGLFIGEMIINRTRIWQGRAFPMFFTTWITVAAIAFAVEATGIELNWWSWSAHEIHLLNDPFRQYLLGVPFIAFMGWADGVLLILIPFILILYSPLKHYRKARFLMLLLPPIYGFLAYLDSTTLKFFVYPIFLLLVIANPIHYRIDGEKKAVF